jgi:hypothetical protein
MDSQPDMSPPQSQPDDEGDTPNFLMLDQIPANYVQQVETDLLEPVVFTQGTATSDGFARFTLQNKGFLHSHSKLFMTLKVTATNDDCFNCPHLGVAQVVKKAVLKIGNKTINELDSWRGLHAIKSSLITCENNHEREMYMTGRFMDHEYNYIDGSRFDAEGYSLATSKERVGDDGAPAGWMRNDATKPEEAPNFSIDLSDLFPFLKVNQLPLYMIDEPINIELTFYPTVNQRIQIPQGATGNVPIEVVRDDLKFCADYIHYGATDEMQRYAEKNKELNFSFVDYRLVEHSTSDTALAGGVVRNLGMANRLVPRVVTTLVDSDGGEDTLLGETNAQSPILNASGVFDTTLRYNVKYNDRFEYTTAIDNPARLFSQLTNSEGVPFLTRQEYCDEGSIAGGYDQNFEGRDQDVQLSGNFFYLGTRLTNGRVGQRGIDLHITGAFGADVDLMRTYCEYVRVATLKDGMFEIYNA